MQCQQHVTIAEVTNAEKIVYSILAQKLEYATKHKTFLEQPDKHEQVPPICRTAQERNTEPPAHTEQLANNATKSRIFAQTTMNKYKCNNATKTESLP